MCGLRAAIEFANQIGIERIEKRHRQMANYILGEMVRRGAKSWTSPDAALRCGIATVNVAPLTMPDAEHWLWKEKKVRIRGGAEGRRMDVDGEEDSHSRERVLEAADLSLLLHPRWFRYRVQVKKDVIEVGEKLHRQALFKHFRAAVLALVVRYTCTVLIANVMLGKRERDALRMNLIEGYKADCRYTANSGSHVAEICQGIECKAK